MDIVTINTIFFVLASLSCLIGAVVGIIRTRSFRAFPLRLFSVMILLFLFMVYGLAALARLEVIEYLSILKNGILSSIGVFLLSNLFMIMFIVGCKNDR